MTYNAEMGPEHITEMIEKTWQNLYYNGFAWNNEKDAHTNWKNLKMDIEVNQDNLEKTCNCLEEIYLSMKEDLNGNTRIKRNIN